MTGQPFCKDCKEYDRNTRYCTHIERRTGPFVPACEAFKLIGKENQTEVGESAE